MHSAWREASTRSIDRNGAPGGIRTPDQWLRKPLLYPAELQARRPRRAGTTGRAVAHCSETAQLGHPSSRKPLVGWVEHSETHRTHCKTLPTPVNWSFITHLGDAALVLPLLAAAMTGLALQGRPQRRVALQWAAIVATSLLLVAASKIAFYGWGTGIRRWNLTCFSGHTVSAWLAWPALLMLMAPARSRALRIALLLTGIAIAACVGWSRVPLGAHPVSEVIAGTLLGAAAATWIIRALWNQALDKRGIAMLTASLLVLALLTQAGLERPHTERWFQKIGTSLSGTDQPVERSRWGRDLSTR